MESTKLKQITVTSVLTGLALAGITMPGVALAHTVCEADSIAAALGEKSYHNLELRARYQQAKDKDPAANPELLRAKLGSLRTMLSYGSGAYCDTSGKVTMTNVAVFNGARHSNPNIQSVTNLSNYSIIQAPRGTALNELYVQNQSIPDTNVRVGAQFISFDNERFFGRENWRQNPQSYRGVMVTNESLPDTTINLGYVDRVFLNTATHSGEGRLAQNTGIARVSWDGLDWGTISLYDYRIKDKGQPLPTAVGTGATFNTAMFSANNYGARFAGCTEVEANELEVNYELEYAKQRGKYNNPNNYTAHYWVAGIGGEMNGFDAGVRYEVLSGDSNTTGQQFKFLGSNHEYLGTADVFTYLAPNAGVKDASLTLGYTWCDLNVSLAGHRFKPQTGGGIKFGHEWDLGVKYQFTKHYSASAEVAKFKAKSGNLGNGVTGLALGDTTKYWLTLDAKF